MEKYCVTYAHISPMYYANIKGLFKKTLLFQNWKCHAYSNGKRSTVPESLIIMALETVFLPKKFARKQVQEMGEVTLVARKSL